MKFRNIYGLVCGIVSSGSIKNEVNRKGILGNTTFHCACPSSWVVCFLLFYSIVQRKKGYW